MCATQIPDRGAVISSFLTEKKNVVAQNDECCDTSKNEFVWLECEAKDVESV